MSNKCYKDTRGKPKLSLIPYKALVDVALVREFGNRKYKGDTAHLVSTDDFIDAAIRHLYKHVDGERIDPESDLSHLAHAATSILLAINNTKRKI